MKSYGIGSRILAAALIGMVAIPSAASAQNGSWTQIANSPQFWDTAGNWQGNTIANGVDNTATFATAGLTGPFTVALNGNVDGLGGRTIGNMVFSNPNNFAWTIDQGPGYFLNLQTSGANAPNIAVNGALQTATLNVILQGSQGFTKTGAGNLILTQNNDGSSGGFGLSGPISVNGGTLTADYSPGTSNLTNIIPLTDVTLANGGGLSIVAGSAQAVTQSLNSLTVNAGASTFNATVPVLRNQATVGSLALITANLGLITRNAGGLLQFSVPNIAPTATNGAVLNTISLNTAGTIMGGWAVFNLQPYNTVTGTATNVSSAALMSWATINATTGVISALGTTGYTVGSTTNNAGWAAANNADYSANSGTLAVTASSTVNSLRFSGGAAAGYNVNLAGGANTITSGGILVVPTAGFVGPMTISGPGTLQSGGTNDLVVNQYNPLAPFTISANIVAGGSNILTAGGTGTTILSGTNTYTGKTYVSGGTLLALSTASLPGFNVAARVNVTAGTLAVAAGGTGWTSANIDSVLASASFTPDSALGIDVSAAVGNFAYASNVTGARGLTKLDAGTLTLSGASTFTGPMTISGGTVSVASVAASGAASPLGAGSSVVLGGGTLAYTGPTTTWSRPISFTTGGGTFTTTNALTLSGALSGSSGLTLAGGTLSLGGTGTYGGPTVVNAGVLNINAANAFPAGTDLVVNTGATVQVANGVTPAIGSLSGSGTVNIGNATTLTIGGDQASGSFQGVVANGTGGALTIVKNGAGTQVFSAANTYTGGTTINAGTLQVSPQAAATNPLGTSTVTLAGAGGANQATLAFRSLLPIGVSGFNQDVVWKASEGANPIQAVTRGLDPNNVLYTNDVATASLPIPPGGMPLNRSISLTNLSGLTAGASLTPGSSYIFQPYTANNALQLAPQATGTLSLLTPGKYQTINVLANSANGASPLTATLNFSDSSTDVITGLSASDWFGGTPFVVGGMGRYNLATGQFDGGATAGGNPRLYQVTLPLSAADQLKTLTSITFQNTGTAGGTNSLNIFALNGVAPGAPTSLVYSNNLTISADSTLEVSGYTSVTLGTLRAGANALTLNIGAGSTVTFAGGTTLTGTATFNVPTGVTVGLGTVTDGNAGFGFTKAGGGTLTITNGTNYSSAGIVNVSAGTLLVNQPSGLPQSTVPGGVVVSPGATIGVSYGVAPAWQQTDVSNLLTNGSFQPGSFLGLDVAPATTATYALAITAPVGIAKTNTGTLVLSSPSSTYTGSTAIRGGTLSVSLLANGGQPSSIGASSNAASNLTFTNGSTLQYTGPTASTDRSFTFSGGATFDVTQASTVLTLAGTGIGTGAISKVGAGTLALTGLNSFAGGTNVNNGTLRVTPGTLGSGPVSLAGGILSLGSGGSSIASSGFGGHGTGWVTNGSSTFNPVSLPANTLQVTQAINNQAGSAWTQTQVPTGPFTISFTYTVAAASNPPADGITIGFQNAGTTALGAAGGALGYTGITPSVALQINIYPPNSAGGVGSGVGALVNGQAPPAGVANTAPVNAGLVNTPTNVLIQYDGTNINLSLSQVVNGVLSTYTAPTQPLNLASIVGAAAYFGFTGGTGGANAEQDITNFVNTFGSSYGNDVILTKPSSTILIGATAGGPTVGMGQLTMALNGTLNVGADPAVPSGQPYGLTFTGTVLNGANTFNIPTNGPGGIGTLSLGPLSNGTGASITVTGGGNFNVAGGTITGNLNLGTSNMSMGGASLTVGSLDGTAGTISGNATKAITLTFGSDNTATHAYGGNIVNGTGGSLAVVKAGSGKMTLTGANTYSGGTTVQDGTLAVVVDGSLGTGTVTVSTTGTLQYTGSSTATRSFVLGSSILPGGNMVVNAGQTLTVNGGSIVGGTLNGPGTFATDPINGARFANDTGAASAAITSNSPSDRFINFSNSAAFSVPAGVNTGGTSTITNLNGFNNQTDGRLTVGAGSQINVANFQSTGTVTLVPAVSPQTTLITNLGSSPLTFAAGSRTFVGTPPTAPNFVAGMDIHGQNLVIVGGLFVNNGFVADSVSGGSIIVDYNGLYKGAGASFVPIVTQNGGKIQAGNSPGISQFGSLVIGPGAINNFGWQINDAGPSTTFPNAPGKAGGGGTDPVSGWSQLQANKIPSPLPPHTPSSGNLDWTASATPGNQFTFSLETLLGPFTPVGTTTDGAMSDFDPTKNYVWPFITFQGAYTGPTDSPTLTADTLIDTSGFANAIPPTGKFSIAFDAANSAINLVYTVPEPGTLALGSLAGLGLGWMARRRKARRLAA